MGGIVIEIAPVAPYDHQQPLAHTQTHTLGQRGAAALWRGSHAVKRGRSARPPRAAGQGQCCA